MLLTGLLPDITTDPAIETATDSVEAGRSGTIVAPVGIRPPLLAAVASRAATPLVVLTATGRDAESLTNALASWIPGVAMLPAWETLPHERLSPQVDTMARRIAVLRRLVHPIKGDDSAGPLSVLVVPIRAFLQPIISGLADLEPVRVRTGDILDLTETTNRLAELGYERVDMVEGRGQMSVRGGILDVFPPQEPHPLRVELWGDEVDDIRAFSVSDQRTLGEAADGLWAVPCRELLLTQAVRARAREATDRLPGAAEMLSLAAEGIAAPGIESLAPILVGGMESLLDLLPAGSPILASDPERIRARAADLVATTEEFLAAAWSAAAGGADTPLEASKASFLDLADLWGSGTRPWWELTDLPPADLASAIDEADSPSSDGPAPVVVSPTLMRVGARDVQPYRGDFARAAADLTDLARDGWRIVVTTEGPGPGRRIRSILTDASCPAALADNVEARPDPGLVTITTAQAGVGFVAPHLKVAILTEGDLTGRAGASTRDMRRMPSRRRKGVDPLTLHPGDYIVHDQHGIGRFIELVSRSIGRGDAASTRDYLVIEYAPSKRGQPADRLFVPTDALDQISKYTGSDEPTLTKMGGADWAKTKARAKKAVNEVAKELIRLYAVRQQTKGHAFGPDTPWQRELEDAFPYVETPDQLVTIDEVKADMEKPVPMDRLLTGDVGYGKTEIAVRAAFKAIQDGYQAAVLVPTTLLVTQHAETFAERYAGFPVRVAQLSRFQSDAESADVLKGLADGTIDVVVGTHRLITGQIRFKDLGLVVIDEEQRFGVEHKETLKALRTDVDVLAMSATPIPRTLEMAVTGLREMSTLATPPEDRHPILTYVGAYETKQVGAAIRRELLRDGQVFFVHNRVEDIESTAARLAELVPEARVATAHGQMSESRLERVIDDFWHKEIDVLVCTTIVETGLDVSNANTLIVDRADRMGLSQLHQLRGRVGRGRERAYAYFLYPSDKPLTETSLERLRTIASNTDLGAGMQVAMKDLEIRGAGNLLGGEQSGHIAGVGFDLYVRMVSEAVAAYKKALLRGGPDGAAEADAGAEVDEDLRIELPVDATIPEDYVPHERLRLEAYTKFAAARSEADVRDVLDELADRYGLVPEPARRLASLARLRALAAHLGVREIVAQGRSIRFAPLSLPESARMRVTRLYPGTVLKPATRTIVVPAPGTARMGGGPIEGEALLRWVEVLLRAVVAGDKDYEAEATRYRRRR